MESCAIEFAPGVAPRPPRPQLPAGRQREGRHQAPVGDQEALPGPVGGGQRLPAVGVDQPHQVVDRPVAGPVAIRLGRLAGAEVAELVGAVAVAEGQHRPGRLDPDGARRPLGPDGPRVVAELAHQLGEGGGLGREQVVVHASQVARIPREVPLTKGQNDFTIVATETSTLSFIGVPAEVFSPPTPRYTGNMTFLQLAIGYIAGRILVSVLFIPAYFRGELYTSYELLQRRFGDRAAVTDPADIAPWLIDWRGRWQGRADAMLEPRSTEQVAAMVALALEHRVPLVPQGGNTSMVGGATPDGEGRSLLLSLRRMNRLRSISAATLISSR